MPQPPHPRKIAQRIGRIFFGDSPDPIQHGRAVRGWLGAAGAAALLVPALFWLRYGNVPDLGWGLAIFLVVFCLLAALGLTLLRRPDLHTPVMPRNDWLDRVGAFWLLVCGIDPFFGWVLTSAFVLTPENWRWLYAARVALCIVLPVLTALPLLRYVRGRGTVIMLALLVGVTALPVWSAWDCARDLATGAEQRLNHNGAIVWVLPNTQVEFAGKK